MERLTGIASDGTFISIDERRDPRSYHDPSSSEARFIVRTAEVAGLALGGAPSEERLDENGMSVMRFRGPAGINLRVGNGMIKMPTADSGKPPTINGKLIFTLPPMQGESVTPQPSVETDVVPDVQVAPE